MQSKIDNRSICKDSKKASIRKSLLATAAKRQNQILKVYELKIVEKRLNTKQREELKMLFVEGKWFYNYILRLHKDIKLNNINTTNIKEVIHLDKDKNEITSKLNVLSSQQKQAILTRMNQNEKTIATLVKKGKQKHGSLQFKSELTCIPLKQYGISYKFKSCNKVNIQGISGTLLVRTGNQLQNVDELANANLIKKADGYYLNIVAFMNKENFKEIKRNGKEIGLDFGIKASITTSEGEKIDASIEENDRLKKLQREMFRRVKGSNNRLRTINQIQRKYLKLSNKKKDKANKIVHKLKAYDCIVIQDEQIASWQKGWFGKQVQHSCLGLIKAKLKLLPQTVILDKWIPTTKWCPVCHTKHNVSLDERTYICECGYSEDRDVHSAKNMCAIKDFVFQSQNFVPTEHREVTLMEFKASTQDTGSVIGKPGCGSEKITPFKV